MIKELLDLRKKIKSKKPKFLRQDAHKTPRLKKKWRKPKGLQSKMRLKLRGYRRSVTIGFGSPSAVKFFHGTGFKIVKINSPKDIEKVKETNEAALLSKTLGLKSKIAIVKKAVEKNIKIINIKDLNKFLEKAEIKLQKKKDLKKKKLENKSKKKTDVKKKEEKLENLTEEDKKEIEKKEKDKILIKKES